MTFELRCLKGTSKHRFEKGKWVEYDENLLVRLVCLTRRFEEASGVLYTFSPIKVFRGDLNSILPA